MKQTRSVQGKMILYLIKSNGQTGTLTCDVPHDTCPKRTRLLQLSYDVYNAALLKADQSLTLRTRKLHVIRDLAVDEQRTTGNSI